MDPTSTSTSSPEHRRARAGRADLHRRATSGTTRRRRRPSPATGCPSARRRRLVVPGAVRAVARAARGVGRRRSSRGATCARSTACSAGARCSALLIDWGYRSDGIPVPPVRRLDDPAGRSGDPRREDRLADPAGHDPAPARWPLQRVLGRARSRSPSTEPAELQRATQAIADALEARSAPRRSSGTASSRCGRRRPRRAPSSSGGPRVDAGRSARTRARGHARRRSGDQAPGRAALGRGGGRPRLRGRLLIAASWLACHLPEGPLVRARRAGRRPRVPARARSRRPGPAQPRRVCDGARRARVAARRAVRAAAATDPRALERLVRSAFRHHARYYLEVARTPAITRRRPRRAARSSRRPRSSREAFVAGRGRRLRRPPLRGRSSCPRCSSPPGSAATVAPMETIDDPGSRAGSSGRAARSASASSGCARPAASCSPRSGRRPGRARRRPRPHRRRDRRSRSSAPRRRCRSGRRARRRERRADLRRRRPADRASAGIAAARARSTVPADGHPPGARRRRR